MEFRCQDAYKKKDSYGRELPQFEIQQCTCKENFCNSPPGFNVESDFYINSASSTNLSIDSSSNHILMLLMLKLLTNKL